MKIAITGASGFLGSNLINKLKTNNHNVLSISRNTSNPLQNIHNYEPDIVIHCAWSGGNNYKDVNDISQQFTNVYGEYSVVPVLNNSHAVQSS